MRSYQTLALIGSILGIVVVVAVYAVLGLIGSFLDAFGGDTEADREQINAQIAVSVALYLVAIVFPFVVTRAKICGCVLIGIAIVTLVAAGGFGVLSFAILLAGGIAALRWKEKGPKNTALETLNERYAKGEITREEYEQMKEAMKK